MDQIIKQIEEDLKGVIRVRGITTDLEENGDKIVEECWEFVDALYSGNLDEISDEGADVIIVAATRLMLRGIHPISAIVQKLDKMNRETPWRVKA